LAELAWNIHKLQKPAVILLLEMAPVNDFAVSAFRFANLKFVSD